MKKCIIVALMMFFSSGFIVGLSAQTQVKTRVKSDEFVFHSASADAYVDTSCPKILLKTNEKLFLDSIYRKKISKIITQETEDGTVMYIYFDKWCVEMYPFRLENKDDIYSTFLVAEKGDVIEWQIFLNNILGGVAHFEPLIITKK